MRAIVFIISGCVVLGCKSPVPRHAPSTKPPLADKSVTTSAAASRRAATVANVQSVVATVLGIRAPDIPPNLALSKLAKPADDLDVVEIVLALEEEFRIEIPDEALVGAAGAESPLGIGVGLTVEKLSDLVERLSR